MTAFSVDFVDFWPNFQKRDNYFFHLLSQKYDITIDETNPDIAFMSCYSMDKRRYAGHRCKKIFFTGENRALQCVVDGRWSDTSYKYDLTLTFDKTGGKNIYLPLFILWINWFGTEYKHNRDMAYLADLDDLLKWHTDGPPDDGLLQTKTNGCCFLAKNPTATERIRFCREAQKHVQVDCAGPVLNNQPEIGGRGDQIQKIDFIKPYRAIIAFENSKHHGYLTEKALHGFCTRCVPIYWGATAISKYFNDCYVWVPGEEGWPAAIQRLKLILESDEEYLEMVSKPAMKRTVLDEFSPERVLDLLV